MIVFPVKTNKENSSVSPLFGKAKYFAFYDGEKTTIEANPYNKGSMIIDWFLSKGVDKIVIKEMGIKPFNKLKNTNIKVLYAGDDKVTTNDVVENFENNNLKLISEEELLTIVKNHKGAKAH
ncbi:MAG: NifB/NifX family molybdenum-iron cluster-binding protein [Campylobacteraceae bacterium]|nr:NifB/NifX family molybdenum-iron cluster-binding protein [Campylobacteraceae bacterium]